MSPPALAPLPDATVTFPPAIVSLRPATIFNEPPCSSPLPAPNTMFPERPTSAEPVVNSMAPTWLLGPCSVENNICPDPSASVSASD